MRKDHLITLVLVSFFWLPGCGTHYVTPGGGVSLADFAPAGSADGLGHFYQAAPASAFPAHLAMARLQDGGYATTTNSGYGTGRYSLVTTRDIETDDAIATIGSLPMIQGVAPLGRLLVPSAMETIDDLRVPAARLRADMILIYSIDTTFSIGGKSLGPASMLSLGFLPNKTARVTATVAGVLVDVRSGYVYGTTEATVTEEHRASVWSTAMIVDAARITAEEAAFTGFVDEFGKLWAGVVNSHVRVEPRELPGGQTQRAWHRIRLDSR